MDQMLAKCDFLGNPSLSEEVIESMISYNDNLTVSNSSNMQNDALVLAKDSVKSFLGTKGEITFTSSDEEASNLAVKLVEYGKKNNGKHVIIASTASLPVVNATKWLFNKGWKIDKVKVDRHGIVDLENLSDLICKETVLVSIHWANQETGCLQPMGKIKEVIINSNSNALLHSEIGAAIGRHDITLESNAADLITFDSKVCGGPEGLGVIFTSINSGLDSLMLETIKNHGIDFDESNSCMLAGLSTALINLESDLIEAVEYMNSLISYLKNQLNESISEIEYVSADLYSVAGILNIIIPNIVSEPLLINMENMGVAAAPSSGCTLDAGKPSHVLVAMGYEEDQAMCAIRFSISKITTKKELGFVTPVIQSSIKEILQ